MIEFEATKAEAKMLGATWNGRAWQLPRVGFHAHQLIDAGLADASVLDGLGLTESAFEDARLYRAQRDAIRRLLSVKSAMVVLLPGYGKTAVAVIAAREAGIRDIMLVAPAPLQLTWQREIVKWGGDIDQWTITAWDKFARRASEWGKHELLVLDESVLAKNRHSQRFEKIKKVRRNFDRVWLLSGSPTTRYDDDLWTQLNLVYPKAFPSYWRFAERYCIVEETPWARKVVGNKRGMDAAAENSDLIITASETIDLPEYLFETVDVTLSPRQRRAYDQMEREFVADLESGGEVVAVNEIAKLVQLQQIASYFDGQSAKHDALIDLLPGFEPPHLIWTHWKEGAEALWQRLKPDAYWVSGDTSQKDRDRTIENFKAGGMPVLILSIGVGKFGHTLTNARTIHWLDKTWNADDYFQAMHRVKRIGLQHRPLSVTYRAPGTTDDLVEMNLVGKLPGISRMTRADLASLLRGLR